MCMCVAAVQLGIKATRHTLHSWLKSFLSMRKRDCVFVSVILLLLTWLREDQNPARVESVWCGWDQAYR